MSGRDNEFLLASTGHRLTPQRRIIFDALCQSHRTMTAPEMFLRLRDKHPSLGRATVFRSLDALVAAGLAQRFERDGHVYAYASCSTHHHHHLICTNCNHTTEIDEDVIAPLVDSLSRRYGFSAKHQTLDFHGLCAACQRQEPSSAPA